VTHGWSFNAVPGLERHAWMSSHHSRTRRALAFSPPERAVHALSADQRRLADRISTESLSAWRDSRDQAA
jgi:hypothetical protein